MPLTQGGSGIQVYESKANWTVAILYQALDAHNADNITSASTYQQLSSQFSLGPMNALGMLTIQRVQATLTVGQNFALNSCIASCLLRPSISAKPG